MNRDEHAKRGYLPEDARNFSAAVLPTLRTAARHIAYLINEGYDLKGATAFVGNRFLLSARQRLALMRSLATDRQLALRRAKETATGPEVWIDGFNTLITLEVLCSDSLLFACMDGTVRDLAALRGTYRLIPETDGAVGMLLDALQGMRVQAAHILLDEPVSNSGRLKARIAELGEGVAFALDIQITKDVDRTLYGKRCVISSDSVILDRCASWINLAARCAEAQGAQPIKVWE